MANAESGTLKTGDTRRIQILERQQRPAAYACIEGVHALISAWKAKGKCKCGGDGEMWRFGDLRFGEHGGCGG